MFSGIIQKIGTIKSITLQNEIKTFIIEETELSPKQKIGASISVDGACFTVIAQTNNDFTVEAIPETLERTISGNYVIGQKVNLEGSLRIGDSLDGHFVSGHIDFKSSIIKIEKSGDATILTINFPLEMRKFFAFKGSVTINGVSLTISKLNTDNFEVNLIPHTQKITNLGTLQTNSEVNIEIDLLARYIENLLKDKEKEATYDFLQKRGFI